MAAICGTTQALKKTPAPLGIIPNSSALTSGVNKETNKPLLAALVAEDVPHQQEQEKPSEATESGSEEEKQPQEPDRTLFCHPSVWSLQRIWKERTGYLFTDEEYLLADKLIRSYRYRVVEAVLRNTLWMRANSAKLRWNKFSVFAKHWQRNHEEYLAWCATGHLDKKRGHQTPAQKFDTVPDDDRMDIKEWNALAAWFKEYGKVGEWEIASDEWKAMGLRHGHVYTAMKFCGEESIPVTKEQFIDLLLECGGLKAVGAVAGFDEEEA